MASFAPLQRRDGYLPIEDYGLIGDGTTAALVGRDGAIAWVCLPRFDSPPVFCSILDAARGGAFTVAPDDLVESRQFYEPDSGVLVTEMRGRSGLIRLTDALTLRSGADLTEDTPAGRGELLRSIQVLAGGVRLRIEVAPQQFQYDGPQEPLVCRSAITLKLLDHFENGAIVAAPTSSLPEAIGGPRNWDYRYAWIRDAAFSVYGLLRIGLSQEDRRFLAWVLDAVERGGRPRVLYNLDGHQPPPEREDPELEGYSAALCQVALDRRARLAARFHLPGDVDRWRAMAAQIRQAILDEAMGLYDSLCARANPLGLLPEQIDPRSDGFLGNYPQAFSHVGLISSGVNLARALRRVRV